MGISSFHKIDKIYKNVSSVMTIQRSKVSIDTSILTLFCKLCGLTKLVHHFNKDKSRVSGISFYCKTCDKKRYARKHKFSVKKDIISSDF